MNKKLYCEINRIERIKYSWKKKSMLYKFYNWLFKNTNERRKIVN